MARRRNAPIRSPIQLTLFGIADHPLLDEIRQVNLDRTAPLDALALVKRWQDKLNTEKRP